MASEITEIGTDLLTGLDELAEDFKEKILHYQQFATSENMKYFKLLCN